MNLLELIEQMAWVPTVDVGVIDVIQIIILALALYYLIKMLYKTRAWILVKGLLIIGAIYIAIVLLDMMVLQVILQSLFSSLMIAIVIMLQPELQRIVELFGKRSFRDIWAMITKKGETATWYSSETANEITAACESMGAAKTGALIVVERGIPLTDEIESGIQIGSAVSRQLLLNIFEKNTPLHDGAVIIKNNKIEAATCYLPLSTNHSVDKRLGTRHRAALGISENTDCLVIIVSEETGSLSICEGGTIRHNISNEELLRYLKQNISKSDEKIVGRSKSRSPLWLKILTPILSVIIWASVLTVSDPVIIKTIEDVPVVAINTELLDDIGQTYTVKNGDAISVRVKGRRSIVDSMTANDLSATADVSNMSIVYSVPIDVEVNNPEYDISIISKQQSIQLILEDLIQTAVPVEVVIAGDIDNDRVVKLNDVDYTMIEVTCPQSIAKTIDKAVVTIDATNKTSKFITNVTPVLYDKNGDEVSLPSVSMSTNTVMVSVDVYDVAEIPIIVTLATHTESADSYYVLNGYDLEFNKVRIAANDEVLKSLQQIEISLPQAAQNDMASSILINLKNYLPEGCYLAKDQVDQVSVNLDLIKYVKKTLALTAQDIKIVGLSETLDANISTQSIVVTMYCNTSLLDPNGVSIALLDPTLKIQEQEPGNYEASLILTDIDGVIIADPLTVQYTLTTVEEKEN